MRRIENKYRTNKQNPLWNFHSQLTFGKGMSPSSYTCYSSHPTSLPLFLEISGMQPQAEPPGCWVEEGVDLGI